MAMKLNAGEVGRADLFFIDPSEIIEGVNGRWMDHSEEDILSMVRSYEEDGGQIEPVEVRKIEDRKVMLTLGFRRWKAAKRYNELHPDKPMKLKCVVTTAKPEEAFVRNIVENRERRGTSFVDDAFNQRVLREQYGWNDSQIAGKYRTNPGLVGKLAKLPGLREHILLMVHQRKLPLDVAVDFAELTEAKQDEMLKLYMDAETGESSQESQESSEEVTPVNRIFSNGDTSCSDSELPEGFVAVPSSTHESNGIGSSHGSEGNSNSALSTAPPIIVAEPGKRGKGKPSTEKKKKGRKKKKGVSAVKVKIRNELISKGKGKPRSLSEIREFMESMTGPAEDKSLVEFGETVIKFIQGRITDDAMYEYINKVFGISK